MEIKNRKDKLFTLALLAVLLGIYLLLSIPCPIQKFLHFPCPGCGMTRAWLCVLRLDFGGAFRMHSMFWSVPLLIVYYLFDGRLFRCKWIDRVILCLIALGFVVNWIIHLI